MKLDVQDALVILLPMVVAHLLDTCAGIEKVPESDGRIVTS